MIQVGIPNKGRLKDPVADLFRQAGFKLRLDGRSLRVLCKEQDTQLVLLRTEDISTLVAEGVLDAGITTQDLLANSGAGLDEVLALDLGHCRIVVAVPEDGPIAKLEDLAGRRVATSHVRLASAWFAARGVSPRFLEVSGSTEAMVPLGLADAIVDITETGNSLRDNGLVVLDEIGSYQTVLATRPGDGQNPAIARLVRRLHGAIIARTWRLVEYNIPRARLAEAEAITPGYQSPTVTSLENPDWWSVRALVPVRDLSRVMDDLEGIGATAVLQFGIENCRL